MSSHLTSTLMRPLPGRPESAVPPQGAIGAPSSPKGTTREISRTSVTEPLACPGRSSTPATSSSTLCESSLSRARSAVELRRVDEVLGVRLVAVDGHEHARVEDHRRLKWRSLIAATPSGSGGPDSATHSAMNAAKARRR